MPTHPNLDPTTERAEQSRIATLRTDRRKFLHALLRRSFPESRHLRDYADLRTPGASADLRDDTVSATAAAYITLLERVEGLDFAQDSLFCEVVHDLVRNVRVLAWDWARTTARPLGIELPERQPDVGSGAGAQVVVVVDAPNMTLGERYAFITALRTATGHGVQLDGYRVEGSRTYLELQTSPAGRLALGRLGVRGIARFTQRPVVHVMAGGSALLLAWAWLRTHTAASVTVTILGVAITALSLELADERTQLTAAAHERDASSVQVAQSQASFASMEQTLLQAAADLNTAVTSCDARATALAEQLATCRAGPGCPPTLNSGPQTFSGHVVIDPGQAGPLRRAGGSHWFMLAPSQGPAGWPAVLEVEVPNAVFTAAAIDDLHYYDKLQLTAGWHLGNGRQPVLRATSLQRLRVGARFLAKVTGRSPDCTGECRGRAQALPSDESAPVYRLIWTHPPDARDVAGVRLNLVKQIQSGPHSAILGGSIAGDSFEPYDVLVLSGVASPRR